LSRHHDVGVHVGSCSDGLATAAAAAVQQQRMIEERSNIV
jgi:hypothetical protein